MQVDRDDLTRLRDRIDSHEVAAADAGTRREELMAEQQLRATIPEAQAAVKDQLRTHAIEHQRAQAPAAHERHVDRALHMDLGYDQRAREADMHRDLDPGGPGLGL